MREFAKPSVVVSKCLGFAACRYNGLTIPDVLVDRLRAHVEFRPVCAEMEIGLGVPRDPVRIISVSGELRLVQPATGADLTDTMRAFAASFLDSLGPVDGFVLKSRSPSCGLRDTKIYSGLEKGPVIGKGGGFFGGSITVRYSALAVEDEARLSNARIREHFLTKLFTVAGFRQVKATSTMGALVRFQAENKLLFMAYNQAEMRVLGKIVANRERRPLSDVLLDYEGHVSMALARPPRPGANINALLHSFGYFSECLSAAEKAFFLETLERYRAGRVPLSAATSILKSWIVRFAEDYLRAQTYFDPFPEVLLDTEMGVDVSTSRDYWPRTE